MESLNLHNVSFAEEQIATALTCCNTLVDFHYAYGAGQFFIGHYCTALSKNFDTKLERLFLQQLDGILELCGEYDNARYVDAVIVRKIRYLLKLNVQRKTCPPLFAAIGNAGSEAKRKQCLVEALDAVDIPVVFEYITANQNNLIELIQRLGRSRKRQRED